MNKEYPVLFFRCDKCDHLWIPIIKQNLKKDYYVSAYCSNCLENPINELIVKYVNLEYIKEEANNGK